MIKNSHIDQRLLFCPDWVEFGRLFTFASIMNVEWLQKTCLSLPATTEDVKWGNDLCFLVAGKMFCVTSLVPPFTVSFKVRDEEFETLSQRDGLVPAPYMARHKWVMVKDAGKLRKQEWDHYVRQSYELVREKLSRKLRNEWGL